MFQVLHDQHSHCHHRVTDDGESHGSADSRAASPANVRASCRFTDYDGG